MTKAIPTKRSRTQQRDGNQEDGHVPETTSRTKTRPATQHFGDWDDHKQPPSLEGLLELELDLILPVTAIPAPASNQHPVSAPTDKLQTDVPTVSLELLALQSPHGENQQWQTEEEDHEEICPIIPTVSLARPLAMRPEAHSPSLRKEMQTARGSMHLDILSPTENVPSFPSSPTFSSAEDDFDLASPMALPDTPSQTRPKLSFAWDLEPSSPHHDDGYKNARDRCRYVQSKSVQRPERRVPRVSSVARAATPNPRNHRSFAAPTRANYRTPLSTLPEGRSKARHGGIYSLLLKNKSTPNEPTLVEDAHNTGETTGALSVPKASPPRSLSKLKHGGIYTMLRSNKPTR